MKGSWGTDSFLCLKLFLSLCVWGHSYHGLYVEVLDQLCGLGSPFVFMCILRIELRLPALCRNYFCLPSHFKDPDFFFFFPKGRMIQRSAWETIQLSQLGCCRCIWLKLQRSVSTVLEGWSQRSRGAAGLDPSECCLLGLWEAPHFCVLRWWDQILVSFLFSLKQSSKLESLPL